MKLEVCKLSDLEVGESKKVDIESPELKLAVVRISETEAKVVDDTCSHADFSLSEGETDLDEMTIECPQHGALFSLLDGTPQSLPATKPVGCYKTAVVDGMVQIEVEA